ncbi:MAG TPA: 23S rRNA (uridine(2552)-2'-O)-methyltransferase RlmE [Buchnera sp. (in: enterobacteria)]|nr:23S rRNA (uridine(2552)-2'-O)-methyltransferase RlmE [Buchnera sp. (in: enterobacteria)]
MIKKNKCFSNKWLRRHFCDKYVKLANKKGFRSRAIFKLEELQNSDKIFQSGMTVIDLGSAPGSWSEYAVSKIGKHGKIVACDMLPMSPIKNVHFIQGDFREKIVVNKLLNYVQFTPINVVMSDMAANISGKSCIDIPRSIFLCNLALDVSTITLVKGGTLLLKLFQGEGFDGFLKKIRDLFSLVKIRKPNASRASSREVFIVAAKRK